MCLRELGLGYDGEENIVDLSLLTSDYMAQDGDVLTGTLKSEVMISVADSATITLKEHSGRNTRPLFQKAINSSTCYN